MERYGVILGGLIVLCGCGSGDDPAKFANLKREVASLKAAVDIGVDDDELSDHVKRCQAELLLLGDEVLSSTETERLKDYQHALDAFKDSVRVWQIIERYQEWHEHYKLNNTIPGLTVGSTAEQDAFAMRVNYLPPDKELLKLVDGYAIDMRGELTFGNERVSVPSQGIVKLMLLEGNRRLIAIENNEKGGGK